MTRLTHEPDAHNPAHSSRRLRFAARMQLEAALRNGDAEERNRRCRAIVRTLLDLSTGETADQDAAVNALLNIDATKPAA